MRSAGPTGIQHIAFFRDGSCCNTCLRANGDECSVLTMFRLLASGNDWTDRGRPSFFFNFGIADSFHLGLSYTVLQGSGKIFKIGYTLSATEALLSQDCVSGAVCRLLLEQITSYRQFRQHLETFT